MRDIRSLDEYRAFLHEFNWFHDLDPDFQAWARQKNELMYLRKMAELSSSRFKHVFNLYWCAHYGTNPAHAPFNCYTYNTGSKKKEWDSTINVSNEEVRDLRRVLGLKLQTEKWR